MHKIKIIDKMLKGERTRGYLGILLGMDVSTLCKKAGGCQGPRFNMSRDGKRTNTGLLIKERALGCMTLKLH